jgi:hypothetical protein
VDTLPEEVVDGGEGEGVEGEGADKEDDPINLDLELAPAPPLETQSSIPLPLPPKIVWEGVLDMSTISEMSTGYLKKKCHSRALYVSGPELPSHVQIDQSMTVKGKISIPKLYTYLGQIEASLSRAVIVAAVEAVGDDSQGPMIYKAAFNYFIEQVSLPFFSFRLLFFLLLFSFTLLSFSLFFSSSFFCSFLFLFFLLLFSFQLLSTFFSA